MLIKTCNEMKALRKYLRQNKIKHKDDSAIIDKMRRRWVCAIVFDIDKVKYRVSNGFLTDGGYEVYESDNKGLLQLEQSDEEFPIGNLTANNVIEYIEKKGR